MQISSNIGAYFNRDRGDSPVFNLATVLDNDAADNYDHDTSEIICGVFVAAVLVLAVGFFGALVLASISRRLPGVGLLSRPVCRRPPAVGLRSLGFIDGCSYSFSDSGMVITRPFLDLHIAYDRVSRIEWGPGSAPPQDRGG